MSFFNKYPYTDFHELNLDWVLDTINRLDTDISTLEERVTKAAVEGAKDYVDEQVAQVISDFNDLRMKVANLERSFDTEVEALQRQYNQFIQQVNANIALMSQRIDEIRAEINADIIGVNARTDLAIQQNNEYLLDVIGQGIIDAKVINFFTGARVTIQEMFDYLAMLHVDDGLTVDEMANRAKTVNQLIALNISCTDMVMHGNSLYV